MKEFPEINFFGLLVGPRGNSLKKMERDSGAKISIRGKGSVKEGKARPDQYAEDAEEELHCLVIADSEDKVATCVKLINKVIETVGPLLYFSSRFSPSIQAASTPEGQNDHKRNQLRELAALNGTLRDDENQLCQNCGGVGHRKYDCSEQRNFTANILCRVCGNAGHMGRDCNANRDPSPQGSLPANGPSHALSRSGFDSEYASLMAELGEGGNGGDPTKNPWETSNTGHDITAGGTNIPPWRRPEMWVQPTAPQQQQAFRPSQPMYGAGYTGYGAAAGGQWAGYTGASYPTEDYAAYYQDQYSRQVNPS